ncbi:2-oxoglutarate dehydrogenase complex E2 component [Irineochytrium annulatum]|nr:2-oxoglutarate dehydrogenase complex E2 component [Irineochytrium annulatum]
MGCVYIAAEKIIPVPPMADSITEGTLSKWHKNIGEFVARDEPLATIETDKVDVTVNSPESGQILELLANEGDTVSVGGKLVKVDLDGKGSSSPAAPKEAPSPAPAKPASKPEGKPEAKPEAKATPPPVEPKEAPKPEVKPQPTATPAVAKAAAQQPKAEDKVANLPGDRTERRVKMSRMRQKIASRLKESQNTAAALTTFNEVDMSNVMEMRTKYKDLVLEKHGVKLGFMSVFIKACTYALKQIPEVNSRIEGDELVYSDFVDISVAVATGKGLVTPVIRNCEKLSMVEAEKTLAELGKKARDNKIAIEDMAGGTFTISNGGVFGSMMGTPIINQPQSAIFGMHAVKDRVVVVNGKMEIRPMLHQMYIALTYDHRVIDGREATTFLVNVKNYIEDPRRMLLDL